MTILNDFMLKLQIICIVELTCLTNRTSFLTRLRSITFYGSGCFAVTNANFAPDHPPRGYLQRRHINVGGTPITALRSRFKAPDWLLRMSLTLGGSIAPFSAAEFLIWTINLTQHNTKIREIKRAWMDAGSGHTVDECRILLWRITFRLRCIKLNTRNIAGWTSAVKVNAWILKFACLNLIGNIDGGAFI